MYDSEEDERSEPEDGLDEYGDPVWRPNKTPVVHSGKDLLSLEEMRARCIASGLPDTGNKEALRLRLASARRRGLHVQIGAPSQEEFREFFNKPPLILPSEPLLALPEPFHYFNTIEKDGLKVKDEDRSEHLPQEAERFKAVLHAETLNSRFMVQDVVPAALDSVVISPGGFNHSYELQLPVTPEAMAKLYEGAKDAPIGRGTKTVFEQDERKCRYYDPSQFEIPSQEWNETFSDSTRSELLENIRLDLAPNSSVIEAKLYKMVVYTGGSFFKSHLDTQRSTDMFGTIVVEIGGDPNREAGGGVLSVSSPGTLGKQYDASYDYEDYGRKNYVAEQVPESRVEKMQDGPMRFAAFYADCLHSVSKVEEGSYRVVLVYNLLRKGQHLEVPMTPEKESRITDGFRFLLNSYPDGVIGHLLSHQYGAVSMLPQFLKGTDMEIFQALDHAPDLDVLLCPIEVKKVGASWDGFLEIGSAEYIAALEGKSTTTRTFPIDPLTSQPRGFGCLTSEPLEAMKVYFLQERAYWSQLALASVLPTGNEGTSATLLYVHGALLVKKRTKKIPKISYWQEHAQAEMMALAKRKNFVAPATASAAKIEALSNYPDYALGLMQQNPEIGEMVWRADVLPRRHPGAPPNPYADTLLPSKDLPSSLSEVPRWANAHVAHSLNSKTMNDAFYGNLEPYTSYERSEQLRKEWEDLKKVYKNLIAKHRELLKVDKLEAQELTALAKEEMKAKTEEAKMKVKEAKLAAKAAAAAKKSANKKSAAASPSSSSSTAKPTQKRQQKHKEAYDDDDEDDEEMAPPVAKRPAK